MSSIMPTTMFCFNAAARVAASERWVALHATARCWRTLSSQPRYRLQYFPRTLSTRQFPVLLRYEVRKALPVALSRTADRRTYAVDVNQNTNTIQGTIGKGASGVREEAQRTEEKLQAPDHLNEKEKMIFEKLDGALAPTKLEVQDISGGCGSMYGIEIVSERFRGLSILKQQRLVNEVLSEDIKGWHGVQLKTRVP